MSELREECYKCLNNQECISGADYGSIYCMTRRKFKMQEPIDKKEKRIKELEEENASKQKAYDDCYCEYKHYKQFDSIPKQKVKDKIEEVKLSGGGNGKDNVENLARELVIDVLEELLEEGE